MKNIFSSEFAAEACGFGRIPQPLLAALQPRAPSLPGDTPEPAGALHSAVSCRDGAGALCLGARSCGSAPRLRSPPRPLCRSRSLPCVPLLSDSTGSAAGSSKTSFRSLSLPIWLSGWSSLLQLGLGGVLATWFGPLEGTGSPRCAHPARILRPQLLQSVGPWGVCAGPRLFGTKTLPLPSSVSRASLVSRGRAPQQGQD